MGGKRLRHDSDFQLKKRAKKRYPSGDVDRISQLPDDILVTIVSFLSIKEAARTSVLSSRLINLWKHVPRLDFDAETALCKTSHKYELLYSEESCKYVEWVNRVIRSHKAATLKEFRVCFDLSQTVENAITQWLEFALVRHIERLDFDFSARALNIDFSARALNIGTVGSTYYAFPEKFVKRPSQSSSTNFKSLKSLSLKCVNLTREAIEFFLHNCPLLEMVVHFTNNISSLVVCGSSLALKHLELYSCYKLKSVKVSAPNLTSLTLPIARGLLLENVPMLVELSVGCSFTPDYVKELLDALSCRIFQLEILTLMITFKLEAGIVGSKFPQLPKLKKLVVDYQPHDKESLLELHI
ncbi:hypothetical protein ABFS83_10G021300 [Erythranthe nasuta]